MSNVQRAIAMLIVFIGLGTIFAIANQHAVIKSDNSCRNGVLAAERQCEDDMASKWNDEGGYQYPRTQNIKDIHMCQRIADAGNHYCSGDSK